MCVSEIYFFFRLPTFCNEAEDVRFFKFTYVLSVPAIVFSVDEVFSYSVVDLRGISPAVLLAPDEASNLFIADRGLAGDDAFKEIQYN